MCFMLCSVHLVTGFSQAMQKLNLLFNTGQQLLKQRLLQPVNGSQLAVLWLHVDGGNTRIFYMQFLPHLIEYICRTSKEIPLQEVKQLNKKKKKKEDHISCLQILWAWKAFLQIQNQLLIRIHAIWSHIVESSFVSSRFKKVFFQTNRGIGATKHHL